MSELVEKVFAALERELAAYDRRPLAERKRDAARAAIAAVLSALEEPSEGMVRAGYGVRREPYNSTASVFRAMLAAFAAEHGIALHRTQEPR